MHKVTWREGLIIAALAAPLAFLMIGAIGIAIESLAEDASMTSRERCCTYGKCSLTPAMCRVE